MSHNQVERVLAITMLAGLATNALANPSGIILNEFLVDAPGNDNDRQSIELSGCAGQSVDGLVIITINSEETTDNVAWTNEIDDSFYFGNSKYKLSGTSGTGYFVLWNSQETNQNPDNNADASDIYQDYIQSVSSISQDLDCESGELAVATTTRHEACFQEVRNTLGGEAAGEIKNEFSTTLPLIDWPASVAAAAAANSETLTLSDVAKDVDPDTNDDGILDGPGGHLQYLVVVDEFAWSQSGGKEYTSSEANEWDFSAGFNPEAGSRVDNTATGADTDRYISDGSDSDTFRQVYRNWQAGEVGSWSTLEHVDGFGYAPRPAASGTTTVDDSAGSTANYGLVGANLTPGLANETNQLDATCRFAGPADRNQDGVVDFRDLADAASTGDAECVLTVLNALR